MSKRSPGSPTVADGEPEAGATKGKEANTARSDTDTSTPLSTTAPIAYSEIHDDEQAVTAAGFWLRAAAWYQTLGITCQRVITDNGSCYRSGLWHRACHQTGTEVKKTRPRRPQTNGKVERFHRILIEEWAYIRPWTSETQRADAYVGFIHFCNHHRAHGALGWGTPTSTLKDNLAQLVDLSQQIYEGMMVYPGHLKTVTFQHATHKETAPRFTSGFSFQTLGFMLNDNGPTHVDSFSHLDPDPSAETIDQMDLNLFFGPAVCLDVSHVPELTDITADHLDQALADSGLELHSGDMCFFYTGTYDKYAATDEYLTRFAGLGESAAEWIVAKGIKTYGVDSPTPDNPISTVYPAHMMSRREHITHYENLVLTKVVGKRYTFVGFPLKVVVEHGGPTRAVTIVEE